MWWMRVSPLCSRWVPSSMFAPVAMCWSQTCELPDRQELQRPHAVTKDRITCWPGRTDVTPGPTASTVPAPSWPSTTGNAMGASPCTEVPVAAADAGGADFHQDLSLLGVIQFHVLNNQRGLRFVQNGSLQRWSPIRQICLVVSFSPSIFQCGQCRCQLRRVSRPPFSKFIVWIIEEFRQSGSSPPP